MNQMRHKDYNKIEYYRIYNLLLELNATEFTTYMHLVIYTIKSKNTRREI